MACLDDKRKTVVSVDSLYAGYKGQSIFENLSFEVRHGEIFVILGGSGCGKSTLLRLLIGLKQADSGRILINDTDITKADEKQMLQVRKETGVLFQSGALLGSMTLAENVALPLREYTSLSEREIQKIVKMKLAMVNLAGFERHLPSEISGGMIKRAGLARAMALDPNILFFDEPSAGLDPITSVELDELIKTLSRSMGITTIVVTHELESIFNIADRVIMLDRAKKGIIAEGNPKKLKEESSEPFVRAFFNRQPL